MQWYVGRKAAQPLRQFLHFLFAVVFARNYQRGYFHMALVVCQGYVALDGIGIAFKFL